MSHQLFYTGRCPIFFMQNINRIRGGQVVRWYWEKLPVPGRPTIWITEGQGPAALAVGAGIFTLSFPFFLLSPSLWETARYRLKYCLKGPLNPKPTNQPTNQPNWPNGSGEEFVRMVFIIYGHVILIKTSYML